MADYFTDDQRTGLRDILANFKRGQVLFLRHILPIYGDNDRGHPVLRGTALVVEHRGSIFLVTAKHVLIPLPETGWYVYAMPSQKRHLGGRMVCNSSNGKTDIIDVAVLKLEGDGVPPYPEVNCEPLSSDLLSPAGAPHEGNYCLAVGYPASKSRVNTQSKILTAQPYANFGPAISADRVAALGLNPHMHIAVAFHKRSVFGEDGVVQKAPDPAGMSGSPLFLIHGADGTKDAQDAFTVAGTLIEYRAEDKVLLAIDIGVAIELMERCLD